MKTKILLILTLGNLLIGCDNRPIMIKDMIRNSETYELEWLKAELRSFADTTNVDSIDLNTIIAFKTIDLNGTIKTVGMDTALQLYKANIKEDIPEIYPIFEIKNSSKVILPVFGQGLWGKIWGKVLLDKNSMEVLNIEFDHKSETPGVGGNINESIFREQFIGSIITFTENNFTLIQDEKKLIEGKNRIEGLSGATITSKGAVEMLNNDLLKYKRYLMIKL